jgi:hypothetical protein
LNSAQTTCFTVFTLNAIAFVLPRCRVSSRVVLSSFASSASAHHLKMSATTLPKDISKLGQEIKLFGKWDTQESVQSLSRLGEPASPIYYSFCFQCRSKRHFLDGLHPDAQCCLPPPHRRPLRQEAVQKGADAHRRAIGRQVRCPCRDSRARSADASYFRLRLA